MAMRGDGQLTVLSNEPERHERPSTARQDRSRDTDTGCHTLRGAVPEEHVERAWRSSMGATLAASGLA